MMGSNILRLSLCDVTSLSLTPAMSRRRAVSPPQPGVPPTSPSTVKTVFAGDRVKENHMLDRLRPPRHVRLQRLLAR